MYCKRCEKQLEEGVTVCPNCGTKIKAKQITRIVVLSIIGVILLIVGTIFIINSIQKNRIKNELNTNPVEMLKISEDGYITLNNFIFKLPEDLHYSNNEKYLYAATNDLTTSFKLNVVQVNYDNLKQNSKNFLQAIVDSGTEVISYNLTTYTTEYFLVATKQNGKEYLYVITNLDGENIIQALIDTSVNSGYEIAISYINKIIKDYEKINDYFDKEFGSLNDFFANSSSDKININDLFKVQDKK